MSTFSWILCVGRWDCMKSLRQNEWMLTITLIEYLLESMETSKVEVMDSENNRTFTDFSHNSHKFINHYEYALLLAILVEIVVALVLAPFFLANFRNFVRFRLQSNWFTRSYFIYECYRKTLKRLYFYVFAVLLVLHVLFYLFWKHAKSVFL